MIIDLHAHLLPGVDDGAQTLEDSIQLARQGDLEGVEHLLLTPHHRNGQFVNRKADVIRFAEQLSEAYKQAEIKMQVYPCQEIRLTTSFMEDLYNDDLLSIDSEGIYYLIEFPTASVPSFAKDLLAEMIEIGLVPLIAHPERNHQLAKNMDLLYELVEMGCLSQITSSCIAGYYGETLQQTARLMLERNLAHVIASDVHHESFRPFNMTRAFEQIAQDFGPEKVQYLQQNARDIFNGQAVDKLTPIGKLATKVKKKKFFGLF